MKHVALLIETSRTYARDMLRGVKRYVTENGDWSLFLEMRALDSPPPPWLATWKGDGVLSRTGGRETADVLRRLSAPVVELRASQFGLDFPFVGVDNQAIGTMVAEHFLERGFRRFACYALDFETFFTERCDDFVARLAAKGFSCDVHRGADRGEHPLEWERQQEELVKWVRSLPKPVGVLACTDQLGFWLLDACRRAGLAVPEEVAVVGVEDDESLCETASPPLTSVRFSGSQVGHQAAGMLDRLMSGIPLDEKRVLVPPVGITIRRSSDVVALEDPLVARAVAYIRAHASQGLQVAEVARAVGASRSTLERRMKEILGRPPKAEILRVQFDRVQELLRETDLNLMAVARRSGFPHHQYMCEAFKLRFHMTPGEFRSRNR